MFICLQRKNFLIILKGIYSYPEGYLPKGIHHPPQGIHHLPKGIHGFHRQNRSDYPHYPVAI